MPGPRGPVARLPQLAGAGGNAEAVVPASSALATVRSELEQHEALQRAIGRGHQQDEAQRLRQQHLELQAYSAAQTELQERLRPPLPETAARAIAGVCPTLNWKHCGARMGQAQGTQIAFAAIIIVTIVLLQVSPLFGTRPCDFHSILYSWQVKSGTKVPSCNT